MATERGDWPVPYGKNGAENNGSAWADTVSARNSRGATSSERALIGRLQFAGTSSDRAAVLRGSFGEFIGGALLAVRADSLRDGAPCRRPWSAARGSLGGKCTPDGQLRPWAPECGASPRPRPTSTLPKRNSGRKGAKDYR